MRKLSLPILLILMLSSCSDGDLQIETIDFDEGSIQFCDEGQEDTETTLFFKINGDEVLILDLQANLIENAPSDGTITSTIDSQSDLSYRLFSDDVNQSYFCDEIPPVTPTVIEEITATAGIVQITSSLDTVNRTTKTYNHAFTISEVTLVNSLGESITDQTGIDFGDYETDVESSVALVFSNFDSIDISACDTVGETIVLTKVLNDEYISLAIPTSLLANVATEEDTPREVDLSESIIFKNGIARVAVTTDSVCSGIATSELENEFSTTEGKVSVVTVASEPNADGIITYTHTISLSEFVLQDLNGSNAGTIVSYTFGVFATTS